MVLIVKIKYTQIKVLWNRHYTNTQDSFGVFFITDINGVRVFIIEHVLWYFLLAEHLWQDHFLSPIFFSFSVDIYFTWKWKIQRGWVKVSAGSMTMEMSQSETRSPGVLLSLPDGCTDLRAEANFRCFSKP